MYTRVMVYLKEMILKNERLKQQRETEPAPAPQKTSDLHEEEFVTVEEDTEEARQKAASELREDINVVKGVMGDFDLKILEDEEKEIDQLIGDIDMQHDSEQVPNSFAKIGIQDFPLFLTVKELLYLLDSLMPDSFFQRTADRTIKSGFDQDGRKIVYRYRQNLTENRIHDGILARQNFDLNKKLQPDSDDSEDSELPDTPELQGEEIESEARHDLVEADGCEFDLTQYATQELIEIGFHEFRDIFWEEFLKGLPWTARERWVNLTPRSAWLSLMSEVAKPDLSAAYEKWKAKNGFFDLMDLKQHMKNKRVIGLAKRYLVNFLFIDEIQDIPRPLLDFLCRFSSNSVYLSGDNAQNINKSSVLNFKQLAKKIQCRFDYFGSGAAYYPLSINYRSHQQILDLANNIIYHLKLFFPYEVEDLPPEESKSDGPKPVILPLGTSRQQLKEFVKTQMGNSEISGLSRFGGKQVIVTREYETKEEAEKLFPESLVFTIVEAKGMEFDDVILFNYFTDSESRLSWNGFRKSLNITITDAKRYCPIQFTENSVTYCMERQGGLDSYNQVMIEKDKYDYAAWVEKNKENKVAEATDELKLLYVAVTRAKTRLLIYDDLNHASEAKHHRSYFEGVWRELQLVDTGSESLSLEGFTRAGVEKSQDQLQKKLITDALEFMKKGQYNYAEKCFRLAQCPRGEVVSSLHKEAKRLKLNHFSACTSKCSPDPKMSLEEYKQSLKEEGRSISERFIQIGKPDWALQTLTITGDTSGQIDLLKKLGRKEGLAEIYFAIGRVQEAFDEFSAAGNFEGAIGCLQGQSDPQMILDNVLKMFPMIEDPRAAKKLRKMAKLQFHLIGQTLNAKIVLSEESLEIPRIEAALATGSLDCEEPQQPDGEGQAERREEQRADLSFVDVGDEEEMAESLDLLERMSDSFINISVADGEIDVVRSSLDSFQQVASEQSDLQSFVEVMDEAPASDGKLNFEHQLQVSRMASLWARLSPMFQERQASAVQGAAEKKLVEVGMVELEESQLHDLIARFEKIDCLGLAALFRVATGLQRSHLPLFAAKLQAFSQLKTLFEQVTPLSFNSVMNVRDAHERRWLCNIGFLTIRKQFDQQQLKADLQNNRDLHARSAHVLIGLSGFSKQLSSLYSANSLSKVLTAFGDIESLLALRSDLVAGTDRRVLHRLLTDAPSSKLSTIYSTFGCKQVRKCALLNFSIYWLMSRKTYLGADGSPQEYPGKNPHLKRLFEMARLALAGEGEQLHEQMLRIPVFDWMKKNILEQGFLLGFLYNLFHFPNDIVHSSISDNEKMVFKLRRYLKYVPFFVQSFLLPRREQFSAGFYLAFKLSVLPVDLDCFKHTIGSGILMAHKTCHLIPRTAQIQFIEPTNSFVVVPFLKFDDPADMPQAKRAIDMGRFRQDFACYQALLQEKEAIERKRRTVARDEELNLKLLIKLRKELENINTKYADLYDAFSYHTIAAAMHAAWNRSASHSVIFSPSVRSLVGHLEKTVLNVHYSYFLPSLMLLFSLCTSNRCIHLYSLTLQKVAKRKLDVT